MTQYFLTFHRPQKHYADFEQWTTENFTTEIDLVRALKKEGINIAEYEAVRIEKGVGPFDCFRLWKRKAV